MASWFGLLFFYFFLMRNHITTRNDLFGYLAGLSAPFTLEIRNDFVVRIGFGNDPEAFDAFVRWVQLSDLPHEHLDPNLVGFLGIDVVVR